jgi:hypothetical protein
VGGVNSVAKWTLGIIGAVLGSLLLVVAGVLLSGLAAVQAIFGSPPVSTQTETVHTQVVAAIERTEQVSLVSLGIQGIEKKSESTTYFGIVIPGSERTKFLQYSFDAKLGLDGEHVSIRQDSEKQFTITISEFTFIGYDNMHFELATESNGALSWVTPEIDTAAMANSIMSTETKQKYIDAHRDLLREQAVAFYGGIIRAVDPTIDVKFDFGHA